MTLPGLAELDGLHLPLGVFLGPSAEHKDGALVRCPLGDLGGTLTFQQLCWPSWPWLQER